jgi:glutathione synthase/RimK-type ligase-like ATP-grasp enzyme
MFYILRRRGLGLGSTKAIKELSQHDITIVRKDKLPEFNEDDVVLRWGTTGHLNIYPTTSTNIYTCTVLNKAENISLVNNKKRFRALLQEECPEIIPRTWFNYLLESITYPCVLRPDTHAQGKFLYLCHNRDSIRAIINTHPILNGNYYISEYIPKVAEYRVCFIQGLVAWVASKIPKDPQAIAWNVAQGSKFENMHWKAWPITVIEAAYKAYKLSGLYLGGVDVMVDKDGRSYILEINSAPSHTSPYRKQCTTKCIDYGITYKNFAHLPPDENFKKYGKWIHPALK